MRGAFYLLSILKSPNAAALNYYCCVRQRLFS